MERLSEFARRGISVAEVPVDDGGSVDAAKPWIFLLPQQTPPTVKIVVRIRLPVMRQGRGRALSMQAESMMEQGGLGAE